MPLSAVKRDKTVLSQKVAQQVIAYIQENRMEQGDRLPNEREMEARLGVSRGTIREAMSLLRSRGIVEIRQGSGTYIAEVPGVAEDLLGLNFRYDRNRTLADLLEFRFMVEPSTAAACAVRATDEQKRELRELSELVNDQIRRGEDHTDMDIRFHAKIAEYADNELVSTVFPDILQGIKIYQQLLGDRLLNMSIQRHEEIIRCIEAGDERGAYAADVRHLEDNRLAIIAYLKENNKKGLEKYEYRFYRIRDHGQAYGQEPAEGGPLADGL